MSSGTPASLRRRRAIALVTMASFGVTACYTYAPAASAPAAGTAVGLELTDQGRLALGGQLGPGVTRVDGRLVAADSAEYVLRVDQVQQIGNLTSHWTGENVAIRREYVSRAQTRQLHRGRTWAAFGAAAVAVGAFILSRGLSGSGTPGTDGSGGKDPQGS